MNLIRALALASLATGAAACNSKVVHPDLKADPDVLVRQWTLASKSQWSAGERGNDRGSATVFENTLVYSNEAQGVISIYPGALAQRWALKVPKGAATGLLVNGDRGFFAGGDGQVYAFKMTTGEVLWKYPLRSTGPSLPFISGGKLFLTTSDDMVYALDAGSGQWLWSYRRKTAGQPSIAGAASPRMVGSDLVVGLSDGYLVAINPEDGALRWEKKLQDGLRFTDINATLVLDGGVIYVPAYDGELFALRERDREVIWRANVGGARQITLLGNRLIVPTSDGSVVSVDRDSGKIQWKFDLDMGVATEITPFESGLVFGSSNQFLYVLDLEGKPTFRYNAGMFSGFLSAPVWDANAKRLYVVSRAGSLYSFSPPLVRSDRRGSRNPYL